VTAPIIIDDHLLLRVLVDDPPARLRRSRRPVVTTGLWYHRLGRALLASTVIGSMSRAIGSDPVIGAQVVASASSLPAHIDLVSLRDLAWPMAGLLRDGERLNLLSLEALAAADQLGAEIWLGEANENPPLVAAAARRGIAMHVVLEGA